MRYVEIQPGILIDVSSVESIKKIDDRTCQIYTHHRRYEATYPYETLVAMLKEEDTISRKVSDNEQIQSTMQKLDKVLNNAQHIAL